VSTTTPAAVRPGLPQQTAAVEAGSGPGRRLVALDAARGLAIAVMLLAMHPGPNEHDLYQLQHPDWHGLTFADLFFPLFLFAVGVSMTLSPRAADLSHVLRRAAILAVLGIALASLKHERFALTGVLQHIAGAYLLAVAILRAPRRWHAPLAGALVGAVWLAFVLWAWGDDPWGRSGTLAHAVDGAILGGFTSEGLLQTVISTVAVIGGTAAGHLIREVPDRRRLVRSLAARAGGLIAVALVMSVAVPINKRLWTPSFAVLTVGTSFAWLALGVRLIDVAGRRRLVAPLVHLGTNPIAVYVVFMAALAVLDNHAAGWFPALTPFGSLTLGSTLYAVAWTALGCLFAFALYRRRILIKI
jgi:predicted acyltransferase